MKLPVRGSFLRVDVILISLKEYLRHSHKFLRLVVSILSVLIFGSQLVAPGSIYSRLDSDKFVDVSLI